ncbi:FadR/GntR family transcriptional regulator [Aliiruegeria sabulilitoris]|uniref:FadR/GntR family transcriptional regulator n=1 Tax=Aliiruegeria sabulilitoris TaxID=1510458 RepID=UPI00083369CE|nr:FadR/GntR family transcriptional regulator [Aliiruegeria sabulilitoris]NDR54833.1 FadR family transcriptional regulator [Pseudoruegeria sp. M32A2M]
MAVTEESAATRAVRPGTLSDQVYERILAGIANDTYPVGSKLPTEHALCDEFGVSRPVLRQALKQLREDDVIQSRQGSGSYVKRRPEGGILDFAPVGSIADIQRTFEFRAAIEGEAAFLAAKRRSKADLEAIRAAVRELDQCVAEGSLGVDADEILHAAICRASDNQYFVAARNSMRENILTGMNLTRNLSLTKSLARMEMVQAEHYGILDAIERQDAPAARQAMRDHVENARKRVFEGG